MINDNVQTQDVAANPDDKTGSVKGEGFSYKIERLPKSKVNLVIEIEADNVAARTEGIFQEAVKKAKVPGFRTGKATRALYERHYGSAHLWDEAASRAGESAYQSVLEREELQPLGDATFSFEVVVPNQPVTLRADLSIKPKVTLANYKDHGVTLEVKRVEESQIDEGLARLRSGATSVESVDRPAKEHDLVTVNVDVEVDGNKLPTSDGEVIELDGPDTLAGLSGALLAASVGDVREANITFPENYHEESLRGKAANFTMTVTNIGVRTELDDEDLAKSFNLDVAGLREAVKRQVIGQMLAAARGEASDRLATRLLELSEVDLPDLLVEDELRYLINRLPAGEAENTPLEEWRNRASERAKLQLVLDQIAKEEGISVSGEELAATMSEANLKAEDWKVLRDNPNAISAVARNLRVTKTVDRLLSLDEDSWEVLRLQAGGKVVELSSMALPPDEENADEAVENAPVEGENTSNV